MVNFLCTILYGLNPSNGTAIMAHWRIQCRCQSNSFIRVVTIKCKGHLQTFIKRLKMSTLLTTKTKLLHDVSEYLVVWNYFFVAWPDIILKMPRILYVFLIPEYALRCTIFFVKGVNWLSTIDNVTLFALCDKQTFYKIINFAHNIKGWRWQWSIPNWESNL